MKNLFLGIAIVASSLTFAQQFGLKAGVNVSSLSNDLELSDTKSKVGFNAGLFANLPLSEDFSIQPEVLYTQYGSKTKGSYSLLGISSNGSSTTKLDYIAVPVMFQYKALPELYFEVGPEFGFLVSAKRNISGGLGQLTSLEYTGDIKNKLNTFNFGLGVGAGYYFTPNIGINVRYVAGFTDATKSSATTAKNNVFQAGLNYKF